MELKPIILKPGETAIIEFPGRMTDAQRGKLQHQAQKLMPNNKVIILEAGGRVSAMTDGSGGN